MKSNCFPVYSTYFEKCNNVSLYPLQDILEYKQKQRPLKVQTLDASIKTAMVLF